MSTEQSGNRRLSFFTFIFIHVIFFGTVIFFSNVMFFLLKLFFTIFFVGLGGIISIHIRGER